jgi:Methyltransferase FkbM domain
LLQILAHETKATPKFLKTTSLSSFRDRVGQLRTRIYEMRKVFFKRPGLLYRWRLYYDYRRIARGWLEDFGLRIEDVLSARDNDNISRVPNAGKIIAGHLIMHNGIPINPGSYVGEKMTLLLQENRGVHEPQEEAAFSTVLSSLKKTQADKYTMVELGSYWAFYSLWFKTVLPNSECFCVEPDENNLNWGRKNFELNHQHAAFTRAYIGSLPQHGDPPTISVDSLVDSKQIKHIDILHSDIQGYELEMLLGAKNCFERRMIDYIFISTHRHFLHYRCLERLTANGFKILADADLLESHSLDGLIVAVRNDLQFPAMVSIHHRTPK